MPGTTRGDGRRAGHHLVPHTADCIVEAWGPDLATCVAETLQGIVDEFADVDGAGEGEVVPLDGGPGDPEAVLVTLVEDVLFAVDARSAVPVRFHLTGTREGGVAGHMEVVPAAGVVARGPVPKGVSYHDLSIGPDDGGWRCRVLIDV